MKVVWRSDASTVRDVYETLREHRKIAYTTVMTMMNILESRSRVIERVQWENRLEAMEARLAAAGLLRAA